MPKADADACSCGYLEPFPMTRMPMSPARTPPPEPCPVRAGLSLIEVMMATAVLSIGIFAIIGQMASLGGMRREMKNTGEGQVLLDAVAQRISAASFAQLRTSALPWSYARPVPNADGSWPGESTWASPEEAWVRPLNNFTSAVGTSSDHNDGNDLVVQGFLKSESSLKNAQVFIEYYRAMSWFDPASSEPSNRKAYPESVFPGIMLDTVYKDPDGKLRPLYGLLCEANPFKPVTVADFTDIMTNPDTWTKTLADGTTTEKRPGREGYYLRVSPGDLTQVAGSTSRYDNAGNDHGYDSVLIRVTVTWGGENPLNMTNKTTVASSLSGWKSSHRLECWTGTRSGKTD